MSVKITETNLCAPWKITSSNGRITLMQAEYMYPTKYFLFAEKEENPDSDNDLFGDVVAVGDTHAEVCAHLSKIENLVDCLALIVSHGCDIEDRFLY
jgi:hypothetical protein